MKENPIIVRVSLNDFRLKVNSVSVINKETPVCHFKLKETEQAISSIEIDHKNYLFSTNMKGAVANDVMVYTIIETTKANNLNPAKYLNYLFENLSNLELMKKPDMLANFYHGQKRSKYLVITQQIKLPTLYF